MRLSRKNIRRATISILLLVVINFFGMGWWWWCLQTATTTTLSSSSLTHMHVPHPQNHLEENRRLHQIVMKLLKSRPEQQNLRKQLLPNNNNTEEEDEKEQQQQQQHRMDLEKTTNQNNNNNNTNTVVLNTTTARIQRNQTRINNMKRNQTQQQQQQRPQQQQQQQSLLNCSAHGGPYDYESVQEMVYWKDIPQDLWYTSKFHEKKKKKESEPRYLTFDTDLSGFNNQRMVFEINVVTAIVTGRILVLPRDRFIDHLPQVQRLGLDDFFNLPAIAAQMPEPAALRLMTMDEFIQQEGTPDKLNIPTNFTGFYDRTRHRVVVVDETMAVVGDDGGKRRRKTTEYKVDTNGTDYHDTFLLNHFGDKLMSCDMKKLGKEKCSNYTDWIDHRHTSTANNHIVYYVDEYLTGHPKVFHPRWGIEHCVLTIPDPTHDDDNNNTAAASNKANNTTNTTRFQSWVDFVLHYHGTTNFEMRRKELIGNPVPVNAPPEERLAEIYSKRDELCIYNNEQQTNKKYYHMMDVPGYGTRLLGHWYEYLFFEDWKQDLWAKRFVRDKLRYPDQLHCGAARIIAKLRELSQVWADVVNYNNSNNNNNNNATNTNDPTTTTTTGGQYHAMHIRRGDFEKSYKAFGIVKTAEEIFHDFSIRSPIIIPKDSVVYIATDETDSHFFDTFRRRYRAVYFLNDFVELLGPDFPIGYYGMIDQLVCTKSEHFVGTYYSTFTGYINRLRGYHTQQAQNKQTTTTTDDSDKNKNKKKEAFLIRQQGKQKSWFYAPPQHVRDYQRYEPVGDTHWEMEYALGWRNIDYDVDPELQALVDQDILEHNNTDDNETQIIYKDDYDSNWEDNDKDRNDDDKDCSDDDKDCNDDDDKDFNDDDEDVQNK